MKCYSIMTGNGIGVDVNMEKSIKYGKKAAKRNDPEACEYYACLLYEGKHITQNYKKAAKYFKIAADGGRVKSMISYADMLFLGKYIQQDIEKASIYYKMAADTGDSQAIICYKNFLENMKNKKNDQKKDVQSTTETKEQTSENSSKQSSLVSNDSIIEKPNIKEKYKEKLFQGFSCSDAAFEKGLFDQIRNLFNRPATIAGFVVILADTKKYMPLTIHNLVDGRKHSDWYSTKMDHPSISLYFPYHLVELKSIGFKSHYDKHFGNNFLKKFTIYGICDDKTITCIGSFSTEKLCYFKEEVIFKVNSPSPLRAIKIISDSGKFGLNSIEIFGSCKHNEIINSFNYDFLNDHSNYNTIKTTNILIDTDNPQNKIGRKLKEKFKIKKDYIVEWNDISDDEDFEINADSLERKVIANDDEPLTQVETVEACKPEGRSIIQKLEENFDYYTPLKFSDNYPMISFKRQYIKAPQSEFQFWFSTMKIKITGIKIKTCSNPKYLPKSLKFLGNDKCDLVQIKYLLYDIKDEFQPNTEYYFPINHTNKLYNMIALISEEEKPFTLEHVDFYGTASFECFYYGFYNAISLHPVTKYFPYELMPEFDNYDINGPGIFDRLIYYYGHNLSSILTIYSHSKENERYSQFYYNNEISTNNLHFPSIYIFIKNFELIITHIKISVSSKGTNLENFYIKCKDHEFGNFSYKFKPNEEHVFKLDKTFHGVAFNIYGLNGPFSIKKIDVYGELKKTEKNYSVTPFKWLDPLAEDKLNQYYQSIFDENVKNNEKIAEKEKIIFSAKDNSNPSNDIISIGKKKYSNFVTFYSYQNNNNDSILNHNKANVSKFLSEHDGQCSFDIRFSNHAVRLSTISLYVPKLSEADRKYFKYPLAFELYGYNSLTNYWELILIQDKDYETETNKVFYIKSKFFYKTIKFVHYDGDFVLSNISLFGDVKDEKNSESSTFMVDFKNHPSIAWNIFKAASVVYGHSLENYCKVTISPYISNFGAFNLWNGYLRVKNHQSFYCFNTDYDTTIKFFFKNHLVYLDSYSIFSSDYLNSIDSWKVIGKCKNGDTILIDERRIKFKKLYHEYRFGIDKDAEKEPIKLIVFKFRGKVTAFDKIELGGVAIPHKHSH